MSYTTTFKKPKCIKCLSGMFVSKSKLHAQNQNGKYSQSLSWNNKNAKPYLNILKLFLTLITALKSTLKLTRYSVSYRGPTLWNTILDKECVKLPMRAHQVLLLMTFISGATYSTSAMQANKI